MNKRTKIAVLKYLVYTLLMMLLYVLQSDPNLFYIGQSKPMLVLPFAVCIAMFESQPAGGLFGLLAGILCDTSAGVLFSFQSILYLAVCTAVGLLVVYFMQPSLVNSLIFVGGGLSLRLLLEYFLYYVMWGYDNTVLILLHRMLPVLVDTLVVTPLIFWMVRGLHRRFQAHMES